MHFKLTFTKEKIPLRTLFAHNYFWTLSHSFKGYHLPLLVWEQQLIIWITLYLFSSSCFPPFSKYSVKTLTLDPEKESSKELCDTEECPHGDKKTRRRQSLSRERHWGRGRRVLRLSEESGCRHQSEKCPLQRTPAWPGFCCGETLQKVETR